MTKTDVINYVNNFELGTSKEITTGFVTRDICRISEDSYEITECIDNWNTAVIDEQTLIEVLTGYKSWIELDWY